MSAGGGGGGKGLRRSIACGIVISSRQAAVPPDARGGGNTKPKRYSAAVKSLLVLAPFAFRAAAAQKNKYNIYYIYLFFYAQTKYLPATPGVCRACQGGGLLQIGNTLCQHQEKATAPGYRGSAYFVGTDAPRSGAALYIYIKLLLRSRGGRIKPSCAANLKATFYLCPRHH